MLFELYGWNCPIRPGLVASRLSACANRTDGNFFDADEYKIRAYRHTRIANGLVLADCHLPVLQLFAIFAVSIDCFTLKI